MREVDVTVVGGGVVGLAVAAALAASGRSVVILERQPAMGRGITSRNSEVIHAGLYYPEGSLKAALCVEGRRALYGWCQERRVAHRKLGKLVVATEEREVRTLEGLFEQGRLNGAGDLEWLDGGEVVRREPAVRALFGLYSPETGIVDAHGFCLSLLAEAEAHGALFLPHHELISLMRPSTDWSLEIRSDRGDRQRLESSAVVLAAGLETERLAILAGLDPDQHGFRQFPCKGDYFALQPGTSLRLSQLVYPVPAQAGLGIHATLDLNGAIRFGPDAEYIDGTEDWTVSPGKTDLFARAVQRYLPSLRPEWIHPDYAGIRPKLAGPGQGFRDFLIAEQSAANCPGLVLCAGIESPGLTAALAIGRRVVDLL